MSSQVRVLVSLRNNSTSKPIAYFVWVEWFSRILTGNRFRARTTEFGETLVALCQKRNGPYSEKVQVRILVANLDGMQQTLYTIKMLQRF